MEFKRTAAIQQHILLADVVHLSLRYVVYEVVSEAVSDDSDYNCSN